MGVYKDFLKNIKLNYSEQELKSIVGALRLASQLSAKAKRWDGSPMVHHALYVASIIANEMSLSSDTVVASLLHDVVRTNLLNLDEVETLYGTSTAKILKGMNSISSVDAKISTLQADNFRELIISYSTDPRVLLIKIAYRLEVMRSLSMFPELKRNKKSWETLHIYAPLAHKLGLYNIKTELEDISLMHLEPKEYKSIKSKLKESEEARLKFIEKFTAPIKEKLDSGGYNYKVKSRTKSIYSIWKKMRKQKVPFEKVFDIFAIRIILDCEESLEKMQCWTTFSIVTDFYTPNPNRMRDWISIPKSNGYESLHATVLDSVHGEAKWIEVQIRTKRMDEIAEKGVAAHWRYKEQSAGGLSSELWLERLRSIVDSTDGEMSASEEFDFTVGSSEVFVFTPSGDIRKLPEGATVLDFAFDIHSNLGASCNGATVNGKAVSIREKLHSGDIVEIKQTKTQRAKAAWMNFVVTNKAKARIRQILREELASSATLGREELERKLKNWRLTITMEEAVTVLRKYFKVKTGLEIYDMIAENRIPLSEIKEVITMYLKDGIPVQEPKPRKTPRKDDSTSKSSHSDALIIDKGTSGIDYRMAQCCSPICGDEIFGFITIHSGVTIHREGCPNAARLKEQYPYRIVETRWKDEHKDSGAFLVKLRIEGNDSQGVAADISDVLTRTLKINVRSINLTSLGGAFRGEVVVEVTNAQFVEMIIYHLRKIKAIEKVSRMK